MYCPRCGNRLEENARFCGRCGAMLAAGPAADSRKPRKKRGRGCLTAALLLLLFLTLGGGAFAAYHFGVLDGWLGPERQEEPDGKEKKGQTDKADGDDAREGGKKKAEDGEEIRKKDPESEEDSPEEEKENPEKGMEKNGETEAEASETWEELPDQLQETEKPYTVIRPAGAR